MGLAFSATAREQIDEIRPFLASVFRSSIDAPFLNPALIEWKWFAPRPDWGPPRSYVFRQDGALAAHGCAWPVTFLTAGGPVTGTRVIDWAGGSKVPGAGVLMFRRFAQFADTLLAVGGSEETQAILPKIGLARVGELAMYARPVRPFAQWRRRPERGARALARLARNLVWSAKPLPVRRGIEAVRVKAVGAVPLPAVRGEFTPALRTPEMLKYLLACPGAAFSGYEICESGAARGYFLLAHARGQTRIVDLWTEGDWEAAVALAARTAAADPATCEIAAVASTAALRRAIEACGFQPRGSEPIFLFDPKGRLASEPPLHLQLVDGDECYLDNPDYPFWT